MWYESSSLQSLKTDCAAKYNLWSNKHLKWKCNSFQGSPCGFCLQTVTACPTECWLQLWSGIIMTPAMSNRIIYPNINITDLQSTWNSTGCKFVLLMFINVYHVFIPLSFFFKNFFVSLTLLLYTNWHSFCCCKTHPSTEPVQTVCSSSLWLQLLSNVISALITRFTDVS